ncbi:hypothetical protein KKH46_03855, partial [Patescibacteria group bacterium]|nr:hypothetical protein [Patescibacteria group bacterium]MBU1730667.1 hypothetical protein [Patescibacteria group bacterium]
NNVTVTFNDELNDTSPGTDQIAETVQVDATMMVPLMFAKIMGIESKRISAQAATRIGGATGVGGAAPWGPPPLDYQECQRYMLKRGQGSQTKVGTGLSNYSALELPGIGPTPGADWYRDNIIPGGKGSTVMLSVGDNIQTEPGNMVNPTGHGVNERLSMCLHTPKCGSGGCNYIPGCPRVVIVPIMNIDQNGKYEIPILRFEAFLLDENSFDKNQEVLVDGVIQPVGNGGVTGIYLGSYMAPSGTAGGLTGGNLGGVKVVHLIR